MTTMKKIILFSCLIWATSSSYGQERVFKASDFFMSGGPGANGQQFHGNIRPMNDESSFFVYRTATMDEKMNELHKIINNELTTQIDTVIKNNVELAMRGINTEVLNQLKLTTENLLNEEYQKQLLAKINLEIDNKLLKLKDEILKEFREKKD